MLLKKLFKSFFYSNFLFLIVHSTLEVWMVGKKIVSHVDFIPFFLHCPRIKMSLKQKRGTFFPTQEIP